jgi:hypothetical protein
MWLAVSALDQLTIQPFDTLQDVAIALILLGLDPFAKHLVPIFLQSNAFDLGAAEVDAGPQHVVLNL